MPSDWSAAKTFLKLIGPELKKNKRILRLSLVRAGLCQSCEQLIVLQCVCIFTFAGKPGINLAEFYPGIPSLLHVGAWYEALKNWDL